jgi:hypothetical protein
MDQVRYLKHLFCNRLDEEQLPMYLTPTVCKDIDSHHLLANDILASAATCRHLDVMLLDGQTPVLRAPR